LSYYKGNIKLSDDDKTFELLKVLTSSKSELLPFYYYVFNKICLESDGALSEVLGKYCSDTISNNPDYVIKHLTFEIENIKKEVYFYQLYGSMLGYEMYLKENGTSDIVYTFEQFQNYLNSYFKNSSSQNKNTLKLLYDSIAKEMENTAK
jgi:hypothetical protein